MGPWRSCSLHLHGEWELCGTKGGTQWQWKYTSQITSYGNHNWLITPAAVALNLPLHLHRSNTSCGQLPANDWAQKGANRRPPQQNVGLLNKATLTLGSTPPPSAWPNFVGTVLNSETLYQPLLPPSIGIRPVLLFEASFHLFLLSSPSCTSVSPSKSPAHLLLS